MPKNKLFNFINNTPSLTVPPKTRKFLAKNTHGSFYYRFELPQATTIFPLTYHLVEHHVSVYEDKLDLLDCYHFTGSMRNGTDTYTLHIYFDENDRLIKFSLKKQNGDKHILSTKKEEKILNWARKYCDNIISSLKTQHVDKIRQLEQQFHTVEAEADTLSQNLRMNRRAYLEKLRESCAILQQVIPLVSHDRYQHILQLMQQMQKSVNCTPITSRTATPAATTPAHQVGGVPSFPGSAIDELKEPSKSEFEQHLEDLTQKFLKTPAALTPDYARTLNRMLSDYHALSFELDSVNSLLTEEVMHQFYDLYRKMKAQGLKIFDDALSRGAYETARLLPIFYYKLNNQYLVKALQERNAEFLKFLLQNGTYDIDTTPIQIGQQTALSAVHYCFKLGAPMADCFYELIEAGASLLVKDEQGLPIAHRIMTGAFSPLKPVLYRTNSTINKTINSPDFLKQIIFILNEYRLTTELSKQESSLIDAAIHQYRQESMTTKQLMEAIPQSEKELKPKLFATIQNSSDIQRLGVEPSILALMKTLRYLEQQAKKLLSKKEQAIHLQANEDLLGIVLENFYYDQGPYEDKLKESLRLLEGKKTYIEYLLEHAEIKKRLLGKGFKNGIVPRADQQTKQEMLRFNELKERINDFQEGNVTLRETLNEETAMQKSLNKLIEQVSSAAAGTESPWKIQFFTSAVNKSPDGMIYYDLTGRDSGFKPHEEQESPSEDIQAAACSKRMG